MDPSASDRFLLKSSKPSLHINIDCTALVAAVVSRQVAVVHLLLQVSQVSVHRAIYCRDPQMHPFISNCLRISSYPYLEVLSKNSVLHCHLLHDIMWSH